MSLSVVPGPHGPENVVGQVFFERDARRACRGATCHTPRSDFRVPRQAMVSVGFGVWVFSRREAADDAAARRTRRNHKP